MSHVKRRRTQLYDSRSFDRIVDVLDRSMHLYLRRDLFVVIAYDRTVEGHVAQEAKLESQNTLVPERQVPVRRSM